MACVAMGGCIEGSKAPKPVPAKAAKAAEAKQAKAGEAVVARDPAPKGPAQPEAKAEPVADAKAAPAEPVDRGERFQDPAWFRKTLFEDAEKVDFKRSQLDDQGMFSSQFLFDLKAGTDVEACVKALEDKVGGEVGGLTREEAAGRVTLKATTERYRVVMMCGEAKGVMKAYVSYQWTS